MLDTASFVQKRLNGSRCHSGGGSGGPTNNALNGYPPTRGGKLEWGEMAQGDVYATWPFLRLFWNLF